MVSKRALVLLALCCVLLSVSLLVFRAPVNPYSTTGRGNDSFKGRPFMHPVFKLPPPLAGAVLRQVDPLNSIISLAKLANNKSTALPPLFHRIYSANSKPAQLKVPSTFEAKVKKMFARYPGGTSNIDFVEHQNIATTYNKFTDEYSLFNEIRRYRPGYMEQLGAEDEARVEALIQNSSGADKCDFCRRDMSGEDVFGRIIGKKCFTASNIAKYEQWHGLIIGNAHHPLTVDSETIVDYVDVANKWYAAVHERDPTAVFPHAMLDAGPRASASQMHSHMQLAITQDRYFSKAEHTRQAAIDYEEEFGGRNYWADVLQVHEELGLAVRHGNSMILSHLCPVKEREVIVVTEDSKDPAFGEAISIALRALKDDVGTRAFSLAILFQQLAAPEEIGGEKGGRHVDRLLARIRDPAAGERSPAGGRGLVRSSRYVRHRDWQKGEQIRRAYPTIARIVDRGSPLDTRSDVGAMEFFGANNVGADPYHIMPFLRKRTSSS